MKTALITGITGQDGAYLAEFLLSKGYEIHGLQRRSATPNTERIEHLCSDENINPAKFKLHYGDLTDSSNIIRVVKEIKPDEIYNLGAQSHVQVSFDCPEYTADVNALGTLRLLEAIRILGLEHKTRFYQASTSELFGNIKSVPQTETTPFYPRSPYACAKLYAYWISVNYREAYNIFASNGILFNHESPRRGEMFVTRKITRAAARIKLGLQKHLFLGNLSAKRDWGHARDYVEGMWKILQHDKADDFVLATGTTTTIRDFCRIAFREAGIPLEFIGSGIDEIGADKETGTILVKVDPNLFRPAEVDLLIGNAEKAKKVLGWSPKYNIYSLVKEMIQEDMAEAEKEAYMKSKGFDICIPQEV